MFLMSASNGLEAPRFHWFFYLQQLVKPHISHDSPGLVTLQIRIKYNNMYTFYKSPNEYTHTLPWPCTVCAPFTGFSKVRLNLILTVLDFILSAV